MDRSEIQGKIVEIVAEQLGIEEDSIDSKMSFNDDLNADSLDIVELVMRMEETFDLEIEDDDAVKIQTVDNAIDYVSKRLED